MLDLPTPLCMACGRIPADIPGIVDYAEWEEMTPDEWVRSEEGTYNPVNGHFLCDEDYIKAGMPSSSHGWVCP